jgi:hypothetical protein
VPVDHPLVVDVVGCESLRSRRDVHRHDGERDPTTPGARVRFNAAGEPVRAWTVEYRRHADVVRELAARGLRLPTPDEGAYAFGVGSGTLFPWGDRCPVEWNPGTDRR